MMTTRRRRNRNHDTLREVHLLRGCSTRELAVIDRLGMTVDVAAGRVLTREGSAGRECFVTLAGVARAERDGRPIGIIPAGSIAGEMALLDHTKRNATVVADTSMRLLVLNPREFATLLDVSPCVAAGIERITADRRATM